jgi:hypothetical protein
MNRAASLVALRNRAGASTKLRIPPARSVSLRLTRLRRLLGLRRLPSGKSSKALEKGRLGYAAFWLWTSENSQQEKFAEFAYLALFVNRAVLRCISFPSEVHNSIVEGRGRKRGPSGDGRVTRGRSPPLLLSSRQPPRIQLLLGTRVNKALWRYRYGHGSLVSP